MVAKRRNTRKAPKQANKVRSLSTGAIKLLGILALGMVLIGGIMMFNSWLDDASHLPIQRVQVEGEFKYADREKISAIIAPFIKTNLHLIDLQALEDELEFEPWVRTVALTKVWPDKILIEMTEQIPVAFWGDDRLVNSFGTIFDASLPEKKGEIPLFFHPEDQGKEMIEKYKQVQIWLKDLTGRIGVSEFLEDARGSWRLTLTNGLVIDVGNSDQKKRLRRFVVGYTKALAMEADRVRKIDLRYTNGFAVSWK